MNKTDIFKPMTQTAAAKLIGISVRSLRDSDCPRLADGKYAAPEVVQWVIAKRIMELDLGDKQFSDQLERFRCAQADLGEHRLKLLKKQ